MKFPFAFWFDDLLVVFRGIDLPSAVVEEFELNLNAEALAVGSVGQRADCMSQGSARSLFDCDRADAKAGLCDWIVEIGNAVGRSDWW